MNDERWELRAKFEAILIAIVFVFIFVYFGIMCEYEDLTGRNETEIIKEEER